MTSVTSKDGVRIAFDAWGSGTPVILVGGGLDDGSENAPLAAALARRFRAINYARRGRGESGDRTPYAVQREIDDIAALMEMAGEPAHLIGISSGGALVLEAAFAGVTSRSLAVYEVPYDLDPGTASAQRAYVAALDDLLEQGDRDGALALFMGVAGSSPEDIEGARSSPLWAPLLRIAHTLSYDAACLGTREPPLDRLRSLPNPVLVATGGMLPPFELSADAMAEAAPRGHRKVLSGQGHVVDADLFAEVATAHFALSNS